MRRVPPLLLCPLLCALAASVTGCTSVWADFPGEDPPQLWTALVTAAETPDYHDPEAETQWAVERNDVWADPEVATIEIYREIARTTELELMRPYREERTFRFQVVLENTDPPSATFLSRGASVPGKARAEGDRFFNDVRRLLSRASVQ